MTDLVVRPSNGRSLVGDFLGFDPFRALSANGGFGYTADVQRTENGWTVEVPIPGFTPEQIDVTVEDRVLTVTGKNERRSFQRSFLVPEEVDQETIAAAVEHGMLTLTLTLHPKAQPRKIAVTAN